MTIVTDNEVERRIAERLCVTMAAAQATHIPVGSDQWFAELARAALAASDRDVLVPRIPTPEMIAAAWAVIEASKKATGIAKLGPGLGVREIWQAMFDAATSAAPSPGAPDCATKP